jgi:hypothetical protein
MEIYVPYVAGSTALAFIGKGIMNYMHKDNSEILKIQNSDENDKDFFKIEHIDNTIEEKVETKTEEVIEEKVETKTEEVIEEKVETKTEKSTEKKMKCNICKLYLKPNCFSKKQRPKDVRRCKVCSKLSYV